MNRLQNTARIVAASLKNNPHIAITDVPDLIRTIHASLPEAKIVPMIEQPEPEATKDDGGEQTVVEPGDDGSNGSGDGGSVGEADEQTGGRKSWSEALAASRARFGGDGEGVRDEAADEAEVEAHAS